MKKLTIAIAAAATVMMASPVFAGGDAAAGKTKSGMCAACHGAAGISAIPMYPNLAGQKEAYLAKQLKDFKSGARKDPVMAPMAAGLSDEDVANVAAYFASLK
jgi:cytochrome c553